MAAYTSASFSIRGGDAQPLEPYIRAWDDSRRDGIDAVYALVEVLSGPPKDVADVVWEALAEQLNAPRRLTTTRYLQDAIESAQLNLSGFSAREWRASVVLAAITGDDIYLAWAGPAVSWVVTGDEVHYPGYVKPENVSGALGQEGEIPIYVANEQIDEGSTVVVGWSKLAGLVEDEYLSALNRSGIDAAARSIYRVAAEESEFALLMLQRTAG